MKNFALDLLMSSWSDEYFKMKEEKELEANWIAAREDYKRIYYSAPKKSMVEKALAAMIEARETYLGYIIRR